MWYLFQDEKSHKVTWTPFCRLLCRFWSNWSIHFHGKFHTGWYFRFLILSFFDTRFFILSFFDNFDTLIILVTKTMCSLGCRWPSPQDMVCNGWEAAVDASRAWRRNHRFRGKLWKYAAGVGELWQNDPRLGFENNWSSYDSCGTHSASDLRQVLSLCWRS